MAENISEKIEALFNTNEFKKFRFNKLNNSIDLDRGDNSEDSLVFNELGILTSSLMNLNVEFSVANDGTILLTQDI